MGSSLPILLRDRLTADVKVVRHLVLLIDPEYAIVPGPCTSSAGIASLLLVLP